MHGWYESLGGILTRHGLILIFYTLVRHLDLNIRREVIVKLSISLARKFRPDRITRMAKRTNNEWLEALTGEPDEAAISELRALLDRGLRYTLSSRLNTNLDAIVEDFVQESLIKILDKIDTFRGESQFTTWAQKIAVRVALTELRRRRWRDTSLDELTTSRDGESFFEPKFMSDPSPSPENRTTRAGMIDMIQHLIVDELTERQRKAMTLVMLQGMPLEVAAEELGTNRNALYKLIHDARVRLKKKLGDLGMTSQEVLAVFD